MGAAVAGSVTSGLSSGLSGLRGMGEGLSGVASGLSSASGSVAKERQAAALKVQASWRGQKGRNDAREAFWARVEKGDSESGVGGTNNRVILAAVHATAPLPPLKGLTLRCSCTGSSSSSGGGSNSAASPSIAAVDLTALCGKIVAHRMEVSMDHRAVSNGLASWLLAGAGTGEAVAAVAAWEGSRKASLEFLLAQCVALGLSNFNFAPGGTAMDADDDEDG